MTDPHAATSRTGGAGPAEYQRTRIVPRAFPSVLCAVDGTHRSLAAVEQAATLAGPQGHLTLLAVTAVSGSGAYRTAAISPPRAERVLEQASSLAKASHVSSSSLIDPDGPPPEVIIERAAGHDLLALGAPRGSWVFGKFLDSAATDVFGAPPIPLLAAREMDTQVHPFAQRILIASDGSDESDRLVELAARIAREQSAHVVLLNVAGRESLARPHRLQEQSRLLQEALDGDAELQVEVGDAEQEIVRVARHSEASLVLIGTRKLDGMRSFGSVSRRVLADAHCSVLLVPPPADSSD